MYKYDCQCEPAREEPAGAPEAGRVDGVHGAARHDQAHLVVLHAEYRVDHIMLNNINYWIYFVILTAIVKIINIESLSGVQGCGV